MADGNNGKKVFNPLLSYLEEPTPKAINGGGKNADGVQWDRLDIQQEALSESLKSIRENKSIIAHAGKIHLLIKMFNDSLAPSWTPTDLFETNSFTRLISPAYNGFLVETSKDKIPEIIHRIKAASNDRIKVDISRLESIKAFDRNAVLRGKSLSDFDFNDEENQLNIWLLPFHDPKARLSVAEELEDLVDENIIKFGESIYDNVFEEENRISGSRSFKRKLKEYLSHGHLTFTALIKNKSDFIQLLGSGAIYRIEPVKKITTKSLPPGEGAEPSPKMINKETSPAVVVIDGGCSSKSYLPLNVINIKPLISDANADINHGNRVTSLVCQGSAWNNNLHLPQLECKFVSVQAITKKEVTSQPTTEQFINYLRVVAEKTKGISSVWNLSFNEASPSDNLEEISRLGHEISLLAREFNILPVISIGNANSDNPTTLCPPADCEAALTVSGREASIFGSASSHCPKSLRGPAPGGMKKPELSWFSKLRMLGGDIKTGTSFSAPLISSIAAHTFNNLKEPTPDLVKALLINKSESMEHDLGLGWGSPWRKGSSMPWICENGTVTLAWNSKLKAGSAYYWNNIPIPPEMIIDGKIKGSIILTAILKPKLSELAGENYFSTRLQCALQHVNNEGKAKNLLGTMKESTEKEIDSRSELAKWSPIRHHGRSFKGVVVDSKKLRLYARIFTRDLFQFNYSSHHELDEQDVAFVLTFKSLSGDSSIYNSMKQQLGNKVEAAVIERDIMLDSDL
ncbi:S8 family serine peptidase [Cronobacter dublinensis]|nr:S8 family serine peptidase [Cronobacter dublinensis]EMA8655146.1 S8 family serine peptidase [Cronobacter dublinensis]